MAAAIKMQESEVQSSQKSWSSSNSMLSAVSCKCLTELSPCKCRDLPSRFIPDSRDPDWTYLTENVENFIPKDLLAIAGYILHCGVHVPRIFRQSPSTTALKRAQKQFKSKNYSLCNFGAHVAASLLKNFFEKYPGSFFDDPTESYVVFREIAESALGERANEFSEDNRTFHGDRLLFSEESHPRFRCDSIEDIDIDAVYARQKVFSMLTSAKIVQLALLLEVLHRTFELRKENHMNSANLTICFGINLLHHSEDPLLDTRTAHPLLGGWGITLNNMTRDIDLFFPRSLLQKIEKIALQESFQTEDIGYNNECIKDICCVQVMDRKSQSSGASQGKDRFQD